MTHPYRPLDDFAARAAEIAGSMEGGPEARAIYDRAIALVDPARVAALQGRYRDRLVEFDPVGIYKYADLPFWIARQAVVAQRLGLDRSPTRHILDIGMGAGHFAAAAQAIGHRVVGTDTPVPLYDDICDALNVDRRIAPVRRGEPYGPFGARFDLVLIVWQVFDRIRRHPDGRRDYWPLADWQALLADLARNSARPDGTIYLELNREIQPSGSLFNRQLIDWLVEQGGTGDYQLGIATVPASALL